MDVCRYWGRNREGSAGRRREQKTRKENGPRRTMQKKRRYSLQERDKKENDEGDRGRSPMVRSANEKGKKKNRRCTQPEMTVRAG